MASSIPPINIEEVLLDVRGFPLSRENFKLFLESRYAEENLDFWLDSQLLLEKKKIIPGCVVGTNGSGEEKIIRALDGIEENKTPPEEEDIRQNWLGENAKIKQINLSSQLTNELLNPEKTLLLLPEGQREVKRMISGELFTSFLKRAMENIGNEEADQTLRESVAVFSFALLFQILIKLLAPIPNYATFLLCCPFYIPAILSLCVSQTKV